MLTMWGAPVASTVPSTPTDRDVRNASISGGVMRIWLRRDGMEHLLGDLTLCAGAHPPRPRPRRARLVARDVVPAISSPATSRGSGRTGGAHDTAGAGAGVGVMLPDRDAVDDRGEVAGGEL